MKKTLIALAIAGLSFNAAAVNLTADNAAIQTYAQEIKANSEGKVQIEKVKLEGVTFSVPVSTTVANDADDAAIKAAIAKHVRVQLKDATFTGLAKDSIITNVGTDFYVATVNATDASIADLDVGANDSANPGFKTVSGTAVFELAGKADLKVITKVGSANTVTASIYASEADAIAAFPSSVLAASLSDTLVNFKQGVAVKVTGSQGKIVDVNYDSTKFLGGANSFPIFTPAVEFTADVLGSDGNSLNGSVAGSWKAEGPFLKDATVGGTKVTDPSKAFDIAQAQVNYVLPTDNKAEIPTGEVKATWTPSKATAEKYELAPVVLTAANIQKNGSDASQDLVFSADSSYKTFVRVSNTGDVAGKITFTVYADDGSKASFPLNNVAGFESDVLGAQASTAQISLKDLHAAAVAAGLTEQAGKLRIKAEGNVTSMTLQTYVLSTDGTTFSRF
ncbi:TPA: hypothetical protein ACGR4R_002536 [Aeromonas veronii]